MFGPFPVEGQYEVPFTVSLNGQQFTPRGDLFVSEHLQPANLTNETAPVDQTNITDVAALDETNVTRRAVNFTCAPILD